MMAAAIAEPSAERRTVPRTTRTPLWDYVRATGLRSLLLGFSKDPNAKATIILIDERTRRPAMVVKAATTDAAADAVAAEAEVLRGLSKRQLGAKRTTVPRLVEVVDFEGRPAAVMSAVPGISMTTAYMARGHTRSASRVRADFAAASAWLAEFRHATASGSAPLDMDADVSDRLMRRFADDPRVEDDLARLANVQARLREHLVPLGAVHGDFWLGNVLVARDRAGTAVAGVVDWEAGAGVGQPMRDVVRFALMYALYLDRRTRPGRPVVGHQGLRAGTSGEGVAFAIDGAGWFPELFRAFVGDALERQGAPRLAWRDAALAGIAEVAALTDDPSFARRHLELFRTLAGRPRTLRRDRR